MEKDIAQAVRDARRLIQMHEGWSSMPYKCPAGKLTIGYGRNLEANGITKDEGKYMLENDIVTARNHCRRIIPGFDEMDSARQAAFTDFMYNLGPGTVAKFHKTLAAVARKDWDEAANEMMDSTWYKQVGNRGPRIVSIVRHGEILG